MNTIMNEKLEFRILQEVSGHFLTETIPDNWEEMEEENQDAFLEANAWEPLEHVSPDVVWDVIIAAQETTIRFMSEELKK